MTLKTRDKKHLWHPLTQHQTHPESIAIVKAKNCTLFDEDGNTYIDAISSWYTCMYGHCNPLITENVHRQMQTLDQVVFSGLTHEPAIKLSEALIEILPNNQQKLFFSDNGSTAVEVAIKMAFQFYFNTHQKRTTLIAFENGFHGDTFGAMSASGLSVYNGPFENFFIDVVRIPVPNGNNHNAILKQLRTIVKTYKVAAFIFEPLVQGAAGMKMHNASGLDGILEFCKTNDIITIADEVMTGFGKTGKHFASMHLKNQPDIMCLSKALTAGLLPMAITSCTAEIYEAFLSSEISKGFFHGHTYSANPLACTAALSGIALLTSTSIQEQIERISASHYNFAKVVEKHPKVKSTRYLGVIFALDLAIEMQRYGNLRDHLFDYFLAQGVFLRPLGHTIYILPPYIMTSQELKKVYNTIEGALEIL